MIDGKTELVLDIEEYKQIFVRIGDLLELLVYPYLIESKTVKIILEVMSGEKIKDLSDLYTRDILQVSRILKDGRSPSILIKTLLKEHTK